MQIKRRQRTDPVKLLQSPENLSKTTCSPRTCLQTNRHTQNSCLSPSNMIRLLLLLSALTGLEAFKKTTTEFQDPLYVFGAKKTHVYVSTMMGVSFICFDGYFDIQNRNIDCILLMARAEGETYVSKYGPKISQALKGQISTITTPINSATELTMTVGKAEFTITLIRAGLHSGVIIATTGSGTKVRFQVGGNTIKTENTGKRFLYDLSGCRKTDGTVVFLKYEKKLGDCASEECKTPGKVVSTACGANEFCFSGSCKYKATCTFTGPSIIDHKGKVGAIQDRCDYRLMALQTLPDFSVEGTFTERRRKDKSFLDTVVLKHGSITCSLKQGGVVMTGGKALPLTDKPLIVGSLMFFKRSQGVEVIYSEKGMDVVVFFNGYTAQIDITGPPSKDPGLKHLCANAQSAAKDVRITTGSCETKHTDKTNDKIDCNKAKASCGILNNDPFTSCHKHISPSSFIQACSDTMCGYPAVDELTCYFLEAYSRACSLYSMEGVTGWRTKANCPADAKALCQDKPCASNEFCGQMGDSKDWGCLCRPISTQTYRDSGSLGDPTTCGSGSASASLVNCLLVEKFIDYKTLQLKDASCKGDLVDGKVIFKFDSTKTCGAEVTDSDGAVNYKNSIQTKQMPADAILRHGPVDISFACDFAQPKLQLMSFKVTGSSSVVNKPMKSGTFKYELTMTAYADAGLTDVLKSVELNQRVWIELKATGVDSKLTAVLFDSCWATTQADPNSEPKYYLISKGCKNPKDSTVMLNGNGAGIRSIFSFQAFKFPDSNSEVYMHCKVSMCGIKKNKSCVPDCTKNRRRRAASPLLEEEDSSLVTMAWTK